MLKRFILWDFPRGSWQYDVMVGLILAFLFLTPRAWFRDQPRMNKPSGVAMAPSEHGTLLFFVEKESLESTAPGRQVEEITRILRAQMANKHLTVTRLEPIVDSEGELRGYMAFAMP